MKALTVLVVLALFVAHSCADSTASFNIGSTIHIESLVYKTTFQVVEDSSISAPVIDVTFGESNVNVSAYIYSSATSFSVGAGPAGQATGSPTGSPVTTGSLFTTTGPGQENASSKSSPSLFLVMLLRVLGLFNGKVSASSLLLGCGIVMLFSIQLSSAATPTAVSLKLRVPTGYSFDSLQVFLADGSITVVNALAGTSVQLDICAYQAKAASDASLRVTGALNVFTTALLCAQDTINIVNLSQTSSQTFFNVTSDQVNVAFKTPFSGTYTVNSPVAAAVSGACVDNVCRFGNTITYAKSTFIATSANKVTLNFGTTNNGLEPEALDYSPPTPELTYRYSVPGLYSNFVDSAKLRWAHTYGGGGNVTTVGEPAGSILGYIPAWSDTVWWWWYTDPLPKSLSLEPLLYNISFSFRLDGSILNITYPAITMTHICLLKRTVTSMAPQAQNDSNTVAWCTELKGNNPSTSRWADYSTSVYLQSNSTNYYFAARFSNPAKSGAFGLYVHVANISVTVAAGPVVPPTLVPVEKESELVNLRKASPAFDPNPRTNCPHKRTDLKLWHDPKTWGGSVPSAATAVITIPANTAVLATAGSFSTAVYQKIVVPFGSELIFDDSPITLNVKYIEVNGKFWMGSSECRLFSEITVTFYGPKPETGTSDKGIFVSKNGSIDVHGKQYHYTWTRLKATAVAGDDKLMIMDDVNWEVGQQIVVTTSYYSDELVPQNEVMTILAIKGKLIQFTTRFQYNHYAGPEYQVEAGLLSRRIVFQGAEDSEDEKYGGHVQTMGEGRFSGMRLFRMGQQNVLGRYPLHFHLGGIRNGSFIRDCAFQHNYFRCLSIHATHQTLVTRNVGYDIYGHCYYIEDGVEENNTISNNLASFVHCIYANASGPAQAGQGYVSIPGQLEQPADTAASGFYITNMYNNIYGNAASGGWAGYAFPNLLKPIGVSANVSMSPQSRPTLVFDGNSAHSAGYFWFDNGACMYCGGKLFIDSNGVLTYYTGRFGRELYGKASTWTNMKTFLCNMGALHWGTTHNIDTFESHDNVRPATLFGRAIVKNGIVNGVSGNQWAGRPSAHQGFQYYDTLTQTMVVNVQFRNFWPNSVAPNTNVINENKVFISMTHSDIFKPQGMNVAKNISFVNVTRSVTVGTPMANTGAARMFNFFDINGTVTGFNKTAVAGAGNVNYTWWKYRDGCKLEADWNIWVCEKGQREVVYLGIIVIGLMENAFYGSYDFTLPSNKIGNISLWGPGIPDFRYIDFTMNPGVTGISKIGWFWYMPAGSPANWIVYPWQVPYGHWLYLAIKYPTGTTFNITNQNSANPKAYAYNITAVSTMQQLEASDGKSYFFDNSHLYLKVISFAQTNTSGWEAEGVRLYGTNDGVYLNITSNCPGSYQVDDITYCPSSNTKPTQTFAAVN